MGTWLHCHFSEIVLLSVTLPLHKFYSVLASFTGFFCRKNQARLHWEAGVAVVFEEVPGWAVMLQGLLWPWRSFSVCCPTLLHQEFNGG